MRTKTSVIIGLFIFMLTTSIAAQEQYEFALIDFYPFTMTMEISKADDYKKIKVERSDVKGANDVSYAIKEIEKMTKDGWELFNTNSVVAELIQYKAYTFYLRKKTE
jgi:hypothetical protein